VSQGVTATELQQHCFAIEMWGAMATRCAMTPCLPAETAGLEPATFPSSKGCSIR
jgi:hypothetical protein